MTWYLRLRYLLDRLVAALALLVLSPLLIVVAILIARDGGPVFFFQDRVGQNAKIFKVFKFRSMIVDADNFLDERGMPTRERITPIGRFIRKMSIDELPQFLNVIIGDMALIGPRPILPRFLPFMHADERRRLDIKPGLAGWSQVNGRNNIRWSERFKLDVFYLENASLWLDLRITLKAIRIVLKSEDIAHDRNALDVDDITVREPQK